MLNIRFLILLIAINSALPLKKDTKLGKKIPSLKQARCEKIKCPAVEQPICAKLVYRNAGNRTVYVVMVNKCEMNYVKCHEGLEAIVVPMKSCGHTDLIKSGSKRSKRDTTDDEAPSDMPEIKNMILKVDEQQGQDDEKPKEDENAEIYGTEEPYTIRAEFVIIEGSPPDYRPADEPGIGDIEENSGSEYAPDKLPQPDFGDRDAERPEEIDEGKHIPEFYYEAKKEDDEENQSEEDKEDTNEEEENSNKEDGEDPNQDEEDTNEEEENSNKEDGEDPNQDEESGDEESDHGSHFMEDDLSADDHDMLNSNKNISDADGEVNLKQYEADCPTVCPSRDIMVCAKCQHGVFRTFLTTCHMRMFGCRHTDEILELVARVPCVMSAPFLSDATMQPVGRVQEPGDQDRVLRFLRCRELTQQSREDDRRCKFPNDQDTRLMVENYNVNDNY